MSDSKNKRAEREFFINLDYKKNSTNNPKFESVGRTILLQKRIRTLLYKKK